METCVMQDFYFHFIGTRIIFYFRITYSCLDCLYNACHKKIKQHISSSKKRIQTKVVSEFDIDVRIQT